MVAAPNDTLANRYRVLRELARGGMGVVYQVEHRTTGGLHAAKVLRHSSVSDAREQLERFQREARSCARIDSPFVVQITDAGLAPELGNAPFVVMEWLEGSDVADLLARRGHLAPAEVTAILAQVACALSAAHSLGIVHRDIKPANIFVHRGRDGQARIKLLDFGLATAAQGVIGDATVTTSGDILGTPAFMSPEQARGDRAAIQPSTDLWAVAMTAFELLTGQNYWSGLGTAEIISRLLLGQLPPPSHLVPGVDSAFDSWFQQSCRPSASARFSDAQQQLTQLALALGVPHPQVNEPLPPSLLDDATAPATFVSPSSTVAGRRQAGDTELAHRLASGSPLGGHLPATTPMAAGTPSPVTTPMQRGMPLAAPTPSPATRRRPLIVAASLGLLAGAVSLALTRAWWPSETMENEAPVASGTVRAAPTSASAAAYLEAPAGAMFMHGDGVWLKSAMVAVLGIDAEIQVIVIHGATASAEARKAGVHGQFSLYVFRRERLWQPTNGSSFDKSGGEKFVLSEVDFALLPRLVSEAKKHFTEEDAKLTHVSLRRHGSDAKMAWMVHWTDSVGTKHVVFDLQGKVTRINK